MRAVRKMMTSDLQRVRAGLAGADAERLLDRRDEDLAVADLAGVGGLLDRLDGALDLAVVDHDLDLHLGQEAHQVLRAAIDLGLALLAAEALDLADGQAGDAHAGQRVTHLVELERLDDRRHQFHTPYPPASPTHWQKKARRKTRRAEGAAATRKRRGGNRGRKSGSQVRQCTVSPCRLMSRPSISSSVVTRSPIRASTSLRITKVAIAHHAMQTRQPQSWVSTWPALPSIRPFLPAPPIASTANTPVRMA